VLAKKAEYLRFDRKAMTPWDALDYLNTLVDDSDPDIALPQIDHLLQTSEAIRADGHPEWMVLTGFIHDLGKVLCLFGEPQWAVVGDTFPTGCPYSQKVVYSEFFAENPDYERREFQTGTGVYAAGCGLDKVQLSWGHDEYLYHLTRDYLPVPGAVHDPLPLVLRVASRERIRLSRGRHRSRDEALGAEVQSVRPVLEEPESPEARRVASVLRRPARQVSAGHAEILSERSPG
jgi:hypothetical protein